MTTSQTHAAPIDDSGVAAASVVLRAWHFVTLGGRLGRRAAVIMWLFAAIGSGLFLGWGVVVAAGLGSVVLVFLPCAAMCALGLCAGSDGKKCASDKNVDASQP
jgi:hypothetical protein